MTESSKKVVLPLSGDKKRESFIKNEITKKHMKPGFKLLAIPIILMGMKEHKIDYTKQQAHERDITEYQVKMDSLWRNFNKKVNLEQYIDETDLNQLYEKGLLSKNYKILQQDSDSPTRWNDLYLDAVREMTRQVNKFSETKDQAYLQKAITAGYIALKRQPSGAYTRSIMKTIENIIKEIDPPKEKSKK